MDIRFLQDLNFRKGLEEFKVSVESLTKYWEDKGLSSTIELFSNEIMFRAAKYGNCDVVKYFLDDFDADPNYKSDENIRFVYPLSICLYYAQETSSGGNFSDTAIMLMERGADPSIAKNQPLEAAFNSSRSLIVGVNHFNGFRKKDTHNHSIEILLQQPSVAETVFKLKQEKFYFLFPSIEDIFIF